MAKQQETQTVAGNGETAVKKRKKSGAGAVIGSVFLFILTFLSAVVFLGSMTAHTALTKGSVSKAVSQMDLSEAELKQDGVTQSLGHWVYDWYMLDAPNLTPEYADAALARPEMNQLICDYIDDYADYLTKSSSVLPELDANKFADILQDDVSAALKTKTGVTFAETDRTAILWSTEEDVAELNQTANDLIGTGFGKFAIRFLCTLPGVITSGVLLVVFFLLWLIFAVKGHWRKGRMLTGFGCAVAVPNLAVLIFGSVMLLLVNALNVLPAFEFASKGLPTLLQPAIWSSLSIALGGMIVASIGICTNAVVKTKQKKSEAVLQTAAPEQAAAPELVTVPAEPSKSEFVYAEMPEQPAAAPSPASQTGICPHCGAQNEPDSKFCGSCGGTI